MNEGDSLPETKNGGGRKGRSIDKLNRAWFSTEFGYLKSTTELGCQNIFKTDDGFYISAQF